jgi:hypothetical protein
MATNEKNEISSYPRMLFSQFSVAISHSSARQWRWEALAPAWALDLSNYDGNNKEPSNCSLASKSNSWATISYPWNLEVDDGEST